MKNLKKLLDKADNDIFDEIVKSCEAKMASPFKKEKTVVIEAEPEDEMDEGEEKSKLADRSPEDIEKLKQLYEQIKG